MVAADNAFGHQPPPPALVDPIGPDHRVLHLLTGNDEPVLRQQGKLFLGVPRESDSYGATSLPG